MHIYTHKYINTHTCIYTCGNVDNMDQLSLKYNTIKTDYTAMVSTWFTESGITTLTVCVCVCVRVLVYTYGFVCICVVGGFLWTTTNIVRIYNMY